MASRRIRIGQQAYTLVGERDVVDIPDERAARRWVDAFVESRIGAARDIVDLAEDLGGEFRLRLQAAIDIVVRALVRGDLVAVRIEDRPPPLGRSAFDDDDDVRTLGELVDPAIDDPREGPEPPVSPLSLTWISFEVVDDRGERLDGDFRIALDADENQGPLDREPHRYDDIRAQADARLRIEHLRWPATSRPADVDDPVGPFDGPPPVGPDAPGATSFELLAEDGSALCGTFTLLRGDDVLREDTLSGPVSTEETGELAVRFVLQPRA